MAKTPSEEKSAGASQMIKDWKSINQKLCKNWTASQKKTIHKLVCHILNKRDLQWKAGLQVNGILLENVPSY